MCCPTRSIRASGSANTRCRLPALPGMLEKTIILDGFSKTYAMTGWRLGYGVMPQWLVEAVNMLMVNSNSCTASFTQRAGIAALERSAGRRRRDGRRVPAAARCVLRGAQPLPGFRCPIPEGAFYAFPNITGTGWIVEGIGRCSVEEGGRGLFERHGVSASMAKAICDSASPTHLKT